MRGTVRRGSWLTGALLGLALAACGTAPEEFGRSADGVRRAVDPAKELVITDPSVIESPLETTFDPAYPDGSNHRGAWSFGRLVHNMLPASDRGDARAASRFVLRWLASWEVSQQPNALVTAAPERLRMRTQVIDPWKAASGCSGADDDCVLDFTKAPFRLMAIVYRPDLRELRTATRPGYGGEGRFVFERLDANGRPVKHTVIFEYSLPIGQNRDVLAWAERWHRLGNLPFGRGFNHVLVGLTNDFAGPDADVRRPNGNALNQLRTNELALKHAAGCDPSGAMLPTGLCAPAEPTAAPTQKLWELREFHLTADGLVPVPVAQEPSRDFDVQARKDGALTIGTGARANELARWLLDNAELVRAGRHQVPSPWLANSSLVGSGVPAWGSLGTASSAPKRFTWTAPDGTTTDVPEDVRASFALNTCSGCHRHEVSPVTGAPPTQTFLHLTDARALDPAEANDQPFLGPAGSRDIVLSPFLRAEIAAGGPRNADFEALLSMLPNQVEAFHGVKACAGRHE